MTLGKRLSDEFDHSRLVRALPCSSVVSSWGFDSVDLGSTPTLRSNMAIILDLLFKDVGGIRKTDTVELIN